MHRLPNAISIFRSLLAIPIVFYTVSVPEGIPVVALGILALAWVTDGLDGWLARRLGVESELGRVLDPVADKVVIAAMAGALWATGRVPTWLLAVIVGRDAGILVLGVAMQRRMGSVPRANRLGKATLVVLVVTLGAYMLELQQVSAVLKWIAVVAVAGSAVSYGYRFRQHSVRP